MYSSVSTALGGAVPGHCEPAQAPVADARRQLLEHELAESVRQCGDGQREQKGPYPYPLQFTKVYKTIYKTVYKTVYKIHPPAPHAMPAPPAWGG